MKRTFFILLFTLLQLQTYVYAQQTNTIVNSKKDLPNKVDDADNKMFQYLNLSDEQKVKIKAIRMNERKNTATIKNFSGTQNALLFSMSNTQDSINNLLSPAQKAKMRKFQMRENYTLSLMQKVLLSQKQEDQISAISDLAFDEQEQILSNTSLSEEDIKKKIGRLSNETSDKIIKVLSAEQKKQITEEKEYPTF